jgi:hypothetical protein
MVNMS